MVAASSVGGQSHRLRKHRAGGRLAVAGKGDVVEAAQGGRRGAEAVYLEQAARDDQSQHLVQFLSQAGQVHVAGAAGGGAIDLTVDAIEVADLVRVEIEADADTLAAPRNHRVDVKVI